MEVLVKLYPRNVLVLEKQFLLYHLSMDMMIFSHDVSDGDISLVGNCDITQL